jgi:hypothetical protein
MSRWWVFLLLLGCGGVPGEPPAEATGPARLLILSSTIGYIEPCGCTVDLLLGGIDRVLTAVEAERALGPTAVLVVGPHLFEKAPAPHLVAQERAKAQLIARALGAIGVDVVVPTATELLQGADFYKQLWKQGAPPDVTANLPNGRGRLLTLGALKVGVFGTAQPGTVVPGGTATDAAAAARREAARLRAEGAHVVVGLGALPRADLRGLAQSVEGVDLWVLGDHPKERTTTSPAGDSYLLEAGDRGRNLGRILLYEATAEGKLADPLGDDARARTALELQIEMRGQMYARMRTPALAESIAKLKRELMALERTQPEGKRFEYTLQPITKDIVPDPTVAGWVAAYNSELKRINLAVAGEVAPVPAGKSGYAGAAECVDCHEEAQKVWAATPHARAWETLETAGETFDVECVSCHVTGWQKPGGTVLGKTSGLQSVQCEVCHGPSAIHVEVGGDEDSVERRSPEAVCVTCHNSHHSPKFDYATYLPKILGPGHAAREK